MATLDRERNAAFRQMLNRPGLLRIPVCSDALSARIIERLGFGIASISGSGSIASFLGKPDTGLATATEIIDRARQIAAAVDIPLMADADTGYGNINNIRRTIQGFEAAGISAVHIEDQVAPKQPGLLAGLAVIDADEMVEKIRIACKSRRDPNFVIVGRTDAYASHGIDEVIRRCKLYADAGADLLYPHNILDRDHLLKLTREVRNAPLLHDVVEPHSTYSDRDLEEIGFKAVIHGRANIFVQAQAAIDLWTYYRDHGETKGFIDRMISPKDWNELMGAEAEANIRALLADGAN
jgi:2-methylisocitrate lyase-like PEP mutase family enzyme